MRIEQHIGLLEEEIHKYNYSIDLFTKKYLIDKVIEFTETINREAVKANERVEGLYSEIEIPGDDSRFVIDDLGFGELTFPKVLEGVGQRDIIGIAFFVIVKLDGTVTSSTPTQASRLSVTAYDTISAMEHGFAPIVCCMPSNGLLRVKGIPDSFANANNFIRLRLFLADQRDALDAGYTQADELEMPMKVASSFKLQMLLKKDIFSSLGIKEEPQEKAAQ
jgi:hypothetical protein